MRQLTLHPAVLAQAGRLVAIRRELHQRPELGFEEHQTARLIVEELRGARVTVRQGVARTGVVAVMENGEGPCIALRADMDALPIRESSSAPYRSQNDGVMHACGHDGHVAMLLGAVQALDAVRDSWRGRVKFLFQPAEEGRGGAAQMISDGALDDPRPIAAFGAHLWNFQEVGTVGVRPGAVMAAADRVVINVRGKGGHGAVPHQSIDAIAVAAHLIVALQSIVSRSVNPLESSVISIGEVRGGYSYNIIADEVLLHGTARAYREEVRQLLKRRLAEVCRGVAQSFGAAVDLEYRDGYPPTVNDPAMSEVVLRAARRVVGEGAGEPYMTMGGEDMAYYLREVPGCFFFVGSSPRGAPVVPHHHPSFDFDEQALAIGASVFVNVVLDMLGL